MSHFNSSLITASMNGMYNAASVGIYNNTKHNQVVDTFRAALYNKEIIEEKM
jgi:hypothetical protein